MIQLKDRIKELMDYSGYSVVDFAKHLGLKSASAIRELISGRTKTLSDAVSMHITHAYPNINQEWLHDGIGAMFNDNQKESFEVGIGIGQQKGGRNNFKIELKEGETPTLVTTEDSASNPQNKIDFLQKLLDEKDARIAELTASLERERKMNDYLMKQK